MPIYEFHCKDCNREFETLVSRTSPEAVECPHCHGARVSRELSIFASAMSGGGGGSSAPSPGAGGGCCGGGCGCR